MAKDCLICDRITQIQAGINPYFVRELTAGYVVIGDYQFFKGYTLFLCKRHVFELHELDDEFKKKFLYEMSIVAKSVFDAFKPRKLNYELLGNSEPHLHWHIIPRHQTDPIPNKPIWAINKNIRYNVKTKPTSEELAKLKEILISSLSTYSI